jgi:hypothetical protein
MILVIIILGGAASLFAAMWVGSQFHIQDVKAENDALRAEVGTARGEAKHWREAHAALWQHAASGMGSLRRELGKFPGSDVLGADDVDDTDLPPQWDHVEGD